MTAYATVETVDQCAQFCKNTNDCPDNPHGCELWEKRCKAFNWIEAEKKCELVRNPCRAEYLSDQSGTDYYVLDECSGRVLTRIFNILLI